MFKKLSVGAKFISASKEAKQKSVKNPKDDMKIQQTNEKEESVLKYHVFINKNGVITEDGDVDDNPKNDDDGDITFEKLLETEKLKIKPWLKDNLKNMPITRPTLIQSKTIPLIIKGVDTLFCSPTGSGKTLTYLLPILQNLEHNETNLSLVVILPTRELSNQVYTEVCMLVENSNLCVGDIQNYYKNLNNNDLIKHYDIIVSTPKKLIDVIKIKKDCMNSVKWMVLDEGDLLLDITSKNGFCDQIKKIYNKCIHPDIIRIVSTATLHENVERWGSTQLHHSTKVVVYQLNSNIIQKLQYVGDEKGRIYQLLLMIKSGIQPPVLIFVNNYEQGLDLVKQLNRNGIAGKMFSSAIHRRSQMLKDFRVGKIHFLITTDVLSRGIDFKGVNFVINYHFPYSPSVYIHRIGRTGRCGFTGNAITFYTEEDKFLIKNLIPILQKTNIQIPDWLEKSVEINSAANKITDPKSFKPNHVSTRKRKQVSTK